MATSISLQPKEVRDTELFMARAQSIRNVLANTYDIPAGRIFIEKNPAVIASLDPQKELRHSVHQ